MAMTELADATWAPPAPGSPELEERLESYRRELTAYCYRMLGSTFESEDAVQDTLLRAWKSYEGFEGRSQLRSWLYRIATNVCLDLLEGRNRRARPMDLGPAGEADAANLGGPLPENTWIEPMPDGRVVPEAGDPAEIAELKESVRLAFIAALQTLPPKQRAVLILREVLRWKADEVATLLDTSVQSVNSALQRARDSVEKNKGEQASPSMDEEHTALLARYVEAFESYDMDRFTALLRDDAYFNMPPYALWLQTHEDIRNWCLGPGIGCDQSRLIPTSANGSPAFGQYKPDPNGGYEPWSLQVLDIRNGEIHGITFFLDTEHFFPLFGLPPRLDP